MTTAWALKKAWPEVDLRIVPDAGHSAAEPGISAGLVEVSLHSCCGAKEKEAQLFFFSRLQTSLLKVVENFWIPVLTPVLARRVHSSNIHEELQGWNVACPHIL